MGPVVEQLGGDTGQRPGIAGGEQPPGAPAPNWAAVAFDTHGNAAADPSSRRYAGVAQGVGEDPRSGQDDKRQIAMAVDPSGQQLQLAVGSVVAA
jgi:hypothetical protein